MMVERKVWLAQEPPGDETPAFDHNPTLRSPPCGSKIARP